MTPSQARPERVDQALRDLVTYCQDAEALIVSRGRAALLSDRTLQLASESVLNRIGDTVARRLTGDFREAHAEIPWSRIAGMGIKVAHLYHQLDYDLVWDTLENDLPELRAQVERILAEGSPEPPL